jgi:hypothetical protein
MSDIEDLEQRMVEYEAQTIHGAINLNVTRSLVIALIGRMYRSGMVTKEFANQVFEGAETNIAAAQRVMAERGADDEVVRLTIEHMERLRASMGLGLEAVGR